MSATDKKHTKNKHIIIVAYYFPPLGLAGTNRPLAMANYFAERGYIVTVLTVKSIDYPVHDDTQLKKLHQKVAVVRSGSADPARIARIVPVLPKVKRIRRVAKSATASALFPDSKIGFVQSAGRMLRQVLREDCPNILITTSPPMSIHQIGLDALEEEEISWVADFRDVWTSVPEAQQSPEFLRKAQAYRKEIAKRASLVTATSPRTVELLRKNGAKKTQVLFNGYKEDDFAKKHPKRVMAMGLYGTLNELIGVEKLFDWFGRWRSQRDSNLKLRHIGYTDLPGLAEMLDNFDLKSSFASTGYLPHDQSLLEIRRHQLNVIMLTDQVDTSYIIPSKLFELMRAEPPLIAILPRGNAARELLQELNLPQVQVVDSYEEFCSAVDAFVELKRERNAPVPEDVEQFEWDRQLANLETQIERL